MDGLQGDFLSFYFWTGDGRYSSKELGLTRVSDGDRFQDKLIPEINDKTVEIPGVDGMYFYGSDFKQQTFSIKVAFDGITEEQLRKIRQVFAYKHTGELIFEERPYKKYKVKVASPPELDYVCFDEPDGSGDTYTISTTRKEKYPVLFNGNNETIDTFPILLNTAIITSGEYIEADLNYPSLIDENTLYVTFNGVEYECPQQDYSFDNVTGYEYGAPWSDSLEDYDWSEYPFSINSEIDGGGTLYNTLYTAINGEHSITIKKKEVINRNYLIEEEEPITQRIYKGEGTIEFVAYYPYATQTYKLLDEYGTATDLPITNVDEWIDSAGIQNSQFFDVNHIDEYTTLIGSNSQFFNVYNPGDMATGFKIFVPFDNLRVTQTGIEIVDENNDVTIPEFSIEYYQNDGIFSLHTITRKSIDEIGIIINTANGLVEGVNSSSVFLHSYGINDRINTSGNLYNEYLMGDLFKIQSNDLVRELISGFQRLNVISTNLLPSIYDTSDNIVYSPQIYYDYLYL